MNQENSIGLVGPSVPSLRHKHRFVVKEGKLTGRHFLICKLCSYTSEWAQVPIEFLRKVTYY